MSQISFNTSAKCDKAGRQQNQDNYWVCTDLSLIDTPNENLINNDTEIILSEKGALFVVADGMGGMNAGEKASELVISSIKDYFRTIPESALIDDTTIQKYISDSIIYADKVIKDFAKKNREAEGLGSTIVLLWLYKNKAYCGWCGDSRIYRYNPNNNIIRLTHDHSYVQSLVDEGKISEEDAFEHPDSNIVTRNLGDSGETANPETIVYDIFEKDVFLLCTDGLCGLIQDNEIEEIISTHSLSTKEALRALWNAGEKAKWNDNATIELVSIETGGKIAKGIAQGYNTVNNKKFTTKNRKVTSIAEPEKKLRIKMPMVVSFILAILAIIVILFTIFYTDKKEHHNSNTEFNIEIPDTPQRPPVQQQEQPQRPPVQQQEQPQRPPVQQQEQPQRPPVQQQVQPQRPPVQQQEQPQRPPVQQQEQPQRPPVQQQIQMPTLPSEEYIRQFNQTREDYKHILNLWKEVKTTKFISNHGEYNRLIGFAKNVNHLADIGNPDYNKISQTQRGELEKWKHLAEDIEKNINRYINNGNREVQHQQQLNENIYNL